MPNAGKSSLLNLILGQDRAIVSEIAGTTRDTLEEVATIRGIPIRLIDTAGIRESEDIIEREGIQRSYHSMANSQVILWVLDSTRPWSEQAIPTETFDGKNLIVLANKADLAGKEGLEESGFELIPFSVATGTGYDTLLDAIEKAVWGHVHREEPDVAVSTRHAALLDEASRELEQASQPLKEGAYELVSVNLRAAIYALGKISGRSFGDDLLDYIFAKFCIGK